MPKESAQPKIESLDAPEQSVAVTPDNMLEHADTPGDMLHSYVSTTIRSAPIPQESNEKFTTALKHPNTPSEALSEAYNFYLPSGKEDDIFEDLTDNVEHILSHKNVPARVAEDFIKRTALKSRTRYGQSTLSAPHNAAANHPGVSEDLLKDLLTKQIEDPNVHESFVYDKLHPSHYLGLLQNRPIPEPPTPTMTEEQKLTNQKAHKIDIAVLNGLASTTKHDKKTIDQSIEYFKALSSSTVSKGDKDRTVSKFIENQKQISAAQLNRIMDIPDTDELDLSDTKEKILQHPNAEPSMVAKYANMEADSYESRQLKNAALSSPRLPDETRDNLIRNLPNAEDPRDITNGLLRNLSMPPEKVKEIYEATNDKQAILHPNAPVEIVDDFAEKHKDADSVRALLSKKNLPETALTKIITTNKNQTLVEEALEHSSVNMNVLNAALKRRSEKVQKAAMRHPLIAKTQLIDGLKKGKLSPYEILFNKDNMNALDNQIPEDAIKYMHNYYKMSSYNALKQEELQNSTEMWNVKGWLAITQGVPDDIQQQNRQEFVTSFLSKVPKDKQVETGYGRDMEGASDVQKMHVKAVLNLAGKYGDKNAQNALLERPYILHMAKLNNTSYDSDFLTKAYNVIQNSKDLKDQKYGTDRGNQYKLDFSQHYQDIASNPNAPQDVFEKIILDPKFISETNNYILDRHASKEGKKAYTVLDARYVNVPEDQRRDFYTKFASSGIANAADVISRSVTAPKDIWKKAFNSLNSEQRHDWFSNGYDISEFGDHEVIKDAIFGKYPIEHSGHTRYGVYEDQAQRQGLSALDPSRSEDKELLKKYIHDLHNDYEFGGSVNKTSFGNVIRSLDKDFFDDKHQDLIDYAMQVNPYNGVMLAGAKAVRRDDYKGPQGEDVEEFKQYIEQASKIPSEGKTENMKRLSYWQMFLEAAHEEGDYNDGMNLLKAAIGDKSKPNGSLDFLADMPGDELQNNELRNSALKFGLISNAKILEISQSDPKLAVDALKSLSGSTLSKKVRDMISQGNLPNEAIRHIAHHSMNSTTFVDKYRRRDKLEDAELEEAKNSYLSFVNMTMSSDDPVPNSVAAFLNTVGKSDKLGLTKAQKKMFSRAFVDHVQASTIIDQSTKNKILIDCYNKLSQNDSDMIPAKLMTSIVKNAVKDNDITTLIKMANTEDAPASVLTAVSKSLNNPDALHDEDLLALTGMIDNKDVSFSVSSKLVKTLQDRRDIYMARQDFNNADEFHKSIVKSAQKMLARMDRNDEKQYDSIMNTLLPYTGGAGLPLHVNALRDVISTLSDGDISQSKRLSVFARLPSELDEHTVKNMDSWLNGGLGSLTSHPDAIKNANGWKLSVLLHDSMKLNRDAAKVIVNRVMNSPLSDPEQQESNLHRLIGGLLNSDPNLIESEKPEDEDIIKVFRSLKEADRFRAIKFNGYKGSKMGAIIPSLINDTSDMMNRQLFDTPDVLHMDHVHQDVISDMLLATSRTLKGVSIQAFDLSEKDKQTLIDNYPKVNDLVENYHQKLISKIRESGETPDQVKRQIIALDDIGNNLLDIDNDSELLTQETTLKMLRSLSYGTELKRAYKDKFGEELKITRDEARVSSDALSKWTKIANLDSDGWKSALMMNPVATYYIGERDTLDDNLLQHVNIDSVLKESDISQFLPDWFSKMDADASKKYCKQFSEKILDAAAAEEVNSNQADECIAAAIKRSPDSFDASFLKSVIATVGFSDKSLRNAIVSGAGGNEFYDHSFKSLLKAKGNLSKGDKEMFLASPAITDHVSNFYLDAAEDKDENPSDHVDTLHSLLENPYISKSAFERIVQYQNTNRAKIDKDDTHMLMTAMSKHPHIDRNMFFKMYEDTRKGYSGKFLPGVKFHPAFTHPKFGGELFRSLPLSIPPEVKNVDEKKLVTTAEHSVPKNRLNEALAVIPPEGIVWANFKKQNPKMENWPEVKKLFMSKNNKPVLPEDVANAMSQYDGYGFHVTYSKWDGAQRHRSNSTNLVMQLNTSKAMEDKLNRDPKLWAFFQFIQENANHTNGAQVSGHPVTPHIASWVRTDTGGGKKGWIIEEFQSDFGARLHDEISKTAEKTGQTSFRIGEHEFSQDEMHNYTNKVADAISGWHRASLTAMEDLARMQGVEALYIHGPGIRASLSGMSTGKDLPVWLQTMYDKVPKELGWEKVEYKDYPVKGEMGERAKSSNRPTYCWKKVIK